MDENTNTDSRATYLVIAGLLVAAGVAVAIVAMISKRHSATAPEPELGRFSMIEPFQLTDHHDQDFDSRSLDGKILVTNFIFTSCATECPLMSRRMQEVQDHFAADDRIKLLSISVDPRTDHPERLAKYAQAFNAGDNWTFLTGDPGEIKKLSTRTFKIVSEENVDENTSVKRTREQLHSEKIAVVDQLGVIRYYANGMNPNSTRNITKVIDLLLEK